MRSYIFLSILVVMTGVFMFDASMLLLDAALEHQLQMMQEQANAVRHR